MTVQSPDSHPKLEEGEQGDGPGRGSLMVLPVVCASAGMALGVYRGGRMAGLRFLAENAHRAPRTVKGWYLYNKTKNYRVMYGGLKEGAKDAAKLGAIGSGWVATEQACEWVADSLQPMSYAKEVLAGGVTGALFAAWNRLGIRAGRRTVLLGVGSGVVVRGARELQSAVSGSGSGSVV